MPASFKDELILNQSISTATYLAERLNLLPKTIDWYAQFTDGAERPVAHFN